MLLRRMGVNPVLQEHIEGLGRVDLLVGHVIIELDGFAHHGDFERDRERDALAIQLGYLPLRFTHHQLFHAEQSVMRTIRQALAR